ncbi:MAG: diguanylate cyclase [Oscillospiraceae bacterium]|nr:diguanylate cyclase [Oscillospiraceae bacterium]
MFKKSFKVKIILPTFAVLVALVVVINIFLAFRFLAMREKLIDEKLVANINTLNLFLDESESNSKAAAVSMALNPEVIEAVRERDTYELLRIFNPMQDLYRINYYIIADAEGTVLARTHEPEHSGDSVASQPNIADALNGKVSSYFETGYIVKVSVCAGAPVYDTDGTLIGVISAGIRFDTPDTVQVLKKLLNSEVTVFFGDTRIATTITREGQNLIGTQLDPGIAEIVIKEKQEFTGEAEIFGEKYKVFYKPLLDAQNEVFATFFSGMPEKELIIESNKSIRDGIILGLGGLVVSAMLLFFIVSTISKPITVLTGDMNHIADGDLHVDINIKGEDEVGHLGKSLNKIANILRKLLDDINIMIAEQEKGNTNYVLNTEEFHGDYEKLASNILELAAISMKDQLTGMPNRRSFDNRLEVEWQRALREQESISILMMDIDKFKNYNDTFGHQQGDVTLQTISKTITQSLKRVTDFAARWGGEEFVVLLPNTEKEGAVIVAENIRKAIENELIPCSDERGRKATISIGTNTLIPKPDDKIPEFITAADAALYRAKETGRNKVCHSPKDM